MFSCRTMNRDFACTINGDLDSMKILHYFLGFPPYRSGGLTKFAFDLMKAQKENGDNVFALWPGRIYLVRRQIAFREHEAIEGIRNVELINPLPVPLDEGIVDTNRYTRSCDPQIFIEFLSMHSFDVIHIHTLMGLHKEFLDAAKALHVKTVFTTHDYFGICPKATLYQNGSACDNDHECLDCIQCNKTALSYYKIMILQSLIYREMKETAFVKALRKKHRADFFESESGSEVLSSEHNDSKMEAYRMLRKYYIQMLESIDLMHFNSSISKNVYEKYMKPQTQVVMPISHEGIIDSRTYQRSSEDAKGKIQITFIAAPKPYKGYHVLREALDQLWDEGIRNFELNVFAPVFDRAPYMVVREDGFAGEELDDILYHSDILVAPSVWYETFGFTVLEAISHGVPVIVSDHVGAKDIVGEFGWVVRNGSVEDIRGVLRDCIAGDLLSEIKSKMASCTVVEWKNFVRDSYGLYG